MQKPTLNLFFIMGFNQIETLFSWRQSDFHLLEVSPSKPYLCKLLVCLGREK